MDIKGIELNALWGRVIDEVAIDTPQHRAFATVSLWVCYTTAIETTLLVATPNLFAKDVLESRLRVAVSDVLTRDLAKKQI